MSNDFGKFVKEIKNANLFFLQDGQIKDKSDRITFKNIMVYADWCGYCQRVKPHYSDIASKICCQTKCYRINGDNKEIVDFLNKKLGKGNIIEGFPTFIQFKNNKFHRIYEAPSSETERLKSFLMGVPDY